MLTQQQMILIGGAAAVGAVYYFLSSRTGDGGSSDSGLAPAMISYLSPGGEFSQAALDGSVSEGSNLTSGGSVSSDNDVAIKSVGADLTALTSDSLLSNVSKLISEQTSAAKLSQGYGFTSDVKGGLTFDAATGAPEFSFKSEFTPKDPSNAKAQIARLTTARDRAVAARDKATARATSLRTYIGKQNTTIKTLRGRLFGTPRP